jgi:hypothetical protein
MECRAIGQENWNDGILRFFGVSVCIPATTFQVKGAGRYDFFGFFTALGAQNLFGAHLDKLFSNRAFTAFKFVYRHIFNLCTIIFNK